MTLPFHVGTVAIQNFKHAHPIKIHTFIRKNYLVKIIVSYLCKNAMSECHVIQFYTTLLELVLPKFYMVFTY